MKSKIEYKNSPFPTKKRKQPEEVSINWQRIKPQSNIALNGDKRKKIQSAGKGPKTAIEIPKGKGIIQSIFNPPSTLTNKETKIIGLDCEMVEVENKFDALARISVVNYYGHVLLDTFVLPTKNITNYRTWVSGVTPSHMHKAIPYNTIRQTAINLLQDKIIVGHALANDFEVLNYTHNQSKIRDTQKHTIYKNGNGGACSLKKLSLKFLDKDIQTGSHSSVEDARAAMALYRLDERNWEEKLKVEGYNLLKKKVVADLEASNSPIIETNAAGVTKKSKESKRKKREKKEYRYYTNSSKKSLKSYII